MSHAVAMDPSVRKTEKVVVAIRVRKLIERERNSNAKKHWQTTGNTIQQVRPEFPSSPVAGTAPHSFDHVFGEDTPTRQLYDRVVAPVVAKSFEGFNGTVLCYGQTSSGKTHTLYGGHSDPGLITMMAEDLFHRIRSNPDRLFYIKLGLLEIYNEKMSDLLNDGQPVEDVEVDGVVVPRELKTIEVFSPEDVFNAAYQIQEKRKTGETLMNKRSSRSHTILRMVIESVPRECNNNDDQLISAVLNFVDLAGSEKSSQTGATGDRLQEANYINKSLMSLCKVVMELSKAATSSSSSGSGTMKRPAETKVKKASNANNSGGSLAVAASKKKYINFRDSKLTRILQSSLNGSAFVVMICNLTPASVQESLSTLRFAKAAKDIKIDPTQNTKYLTATDEYQLKVLELEALLRKKSSEIEELHNRIHVMQTFDKVCSPLPTRSSKPLIPRRKTVGPRSSDTEEIYTPRKEPGPATLELPVEEIYHLKKTQAELLEENTKLKKRLAEAEATADKYRTSHASALKIMKGMRSAMQSTAVSLDTLKRENMELKQSVNKVEADKQKLIEKQETEMEMLRSKLKQSDETNVRHLEELRTLGSKWRQVQLTQSSPLKINRSTQTQPTAHTLSIGVQTPEHIEPMKYIRELKSYARRKEQELSDTKNYYEKVLKQRNVENQGHIKNENDPK